MSWDDGREKSLSDEAKVVLFQGVRELLTNVTKHARARAVRIELRRVCDRFRVTLSDDGVGFTQSPADSERGHGGFGLFNLRERLEQLGGKLTVGIEIRDRCFDLVRQRDPHIPGYLLTKSNGQELPFRDGSFDTLISEDCFEHYQRPQAVLSQMCRGDRNIPDGEVFSCPVKDSVNGVIQYNTPTLYAGTKFENVRLEFKDGRIILRFHGVYGYAKLSINGKPVRDHRGGFTPWDCDLTGLVDPGGKAGLDLEVTDEQTDISLGSAYTGGCIGGILRKVQLINLPACHLKRLWLDAGLSGDFKDGLLRIRARLDKTAKDASLKAVIADADGKTVAE